MFQIQNIECYNSQIRIINQIIYKEFYYSILEGRKNWAECACEKLNTWYGIKLGISRIKQILKDIKSGKRTAVAASDFVSEVSRNSKPASRYSKDCVISQFDLLVNEFIDSEKRYVGLPANQIISVSNKYDYVVACEKNKDMYKFMETISLYIGKKCNVHIENKNIIEYLNNTKEKFNVYELDLMEAININTIEKISDIINKTSMDISAVSITTTGGRNITIDNYKKLMPNKLAEKLIERGFKFKSKIYSGNYKDVIMPMRYELFVIKRK